MLRKRRGEKLSAEEAWEILWTGRIKLQHGKEKSKAKELIESFFKKE